MKLNFNKLKDINYLSFFKKHIFFIILLLILISTRLTLIEQNLYFDGDEVSVALLGKLILNDGYRPLFFYDQTIGGGDAILGYILSIFYFLFGISAVSARLTMLFITCIFFFMLYTIMNQYFNKKTSLITLILFIFPFPSFVMWNIIVLRYLLGFFFHLLIIFFFYRIIYERKKNKRKALFVILFGFFSGFASYIFLPNLIIVIITFFLIGLFNLNFFNKKRIIYFIIFFLIGISPIIYISFSSHLGNLGMYTSPIDGDYNHFDFGGRLNDIKNIFPSALYNSMGIFPLTLSFKNVNISLSPYIYYYIFFILFFFLLLINIRHLMKYKLKNKLPKPELIFLFFFISYLISYIFYWEKSYIYLSPLFYVMLILMGVGISRLWLIKRKYSLFFKFISIFFFLIFLFFGINEMLKMMATPDPQIKTFEIINFLNQNNIQNVYSIWQLASFINFNGDNDVKATATGVEGLYFIKKYYYLDENEPFAVVLPTMKNERWKEPYYEKLNDIFEKKMKQQDISYKTIQINGINVYYNFSKYFRLEDYGNDFLRKTDFIS